MPSTTAEELDAGGRAVRLTNPGRVYFPERGITKGEVVRYFLAVGDGILRAVLDRPTALERWPAGVHPGTAVGDGDAFYHRHLPKGAPAWVQSEPPGGEVCPTELAVVIWAANLGTLSFHPSPGRRAHGGRPDRLWIDLDPQPGTGFPDTVRVAFELRALLAELGLEGFPKTSGGRGLHVTVPIGPRWGWERAHAASLALGEALVRRMPGAATTERFKKDRGERVYVDSGQLMVAAAYSVRPAAHAPVSAPLTWEELESAVPEDFDVRTMPTRFAERGDLHADLDARAQSLEPLLGLVP
jgi:DNA ligase D-like protein (predicted polymerase)